MPSALLIVGDHDFGRALGAALRRGGVEITVGSYGAEVAAAAVDFAIVGNASGAEGLQQTFFAVRSIAAATSTVMVLDIGLDDVDSGSLATLVDGMVKAMPDNRLVLLSDRLDENVRPTGAPARGATAVGGDDVAKAAMSLAADSTWTSGHRLRLPTTRRIR